MGGGDKDVAKQNKTQLTTESRRQLLVVFLLLHGLFFTSGRYETSRRESLFKHLHTAISFFLSRYSLVIEDVGHYSFNVQQLAHRSRATIATI